MPSTKKSAGAKKAKAAPKPEGGPAVDAWIAALKPEHRPLVEQIDALVRKTLPKVQRTIKWRMPFYGLPEVGWMLYVGSFKAYVTLGFFAGERLDPKPPLGDDKGFRRCNIPNGENLDEKQLRGWLKQAAKTRGWGTVEGPSEK